ncbi:DUF177 domain-containing protein [Chloroflexota bacterium]
MQINVSQLLKESIGSTRSYQVSETIDVADDENKSKVEGEVRLMRTNRGILARGELGTELKLTCSRCLSVFDCPLTLNLEEEYIPTIDVVSGAPLPSAEPGPFLIDEHHVIDLTDAMRQCALLAVPMKPLCREDCAGLCLNCGRDLNRGSCDCSVPTDDPRWSELTKLL